MRVCVSVFIMVAIIPHQQIPVSLQLMSSLMMCGVASLSHDLVSVILSVTNLSVSCVPENGE